MTRAKSILVIWIAALLAFLTSFQLPHVPITAAGFISYCLQFLLFIISLYLVRNEPVRKTRFVFSNFTAFFGISILFHLYQFLGVLIFPQHQLARHYFFQYISLGLYFFLFAFAIGYITIDLLFWDFKTLYKYWITLAIVGGFFGFYYHPYFSNPLYLYTTQEISEWKELDRASKEYRQRFGSEPTEEELVNYFRTATVSAPLLERLMPEERETRVRELFPYLAGSSYMILLLKPLYLNTIYMCVLSFALIILYFGYLYKKDPPQGAYIEKMMFFFLLFCTLEIFHAWSFIKTVEWRAFSQYVIIGQYLSAGVLLAIATLFGLRLRFITSAYGEFYEQEIEEHPAGITRWRDAFDNLLIKYFFDRNEFVGRFFVLPKAQDKQH